MGKLFRKIKSYKKNLNISQKNSENYKMTGTNVIIN